MKTLKRNLFLFNALKHLAHRFAEREKKLLMVSLQFSDHTHTKTNFCFGDQTFCVVLSVFGLHKKSGFAKIRQKIANQIPDDQKNFKRWCCGKRLVPITIFYLEYKFWKWSHVATVSPFRKEIYIEFYGFRLLLLPQIPPKMKIEENELKIIILVI